VIAATLTLVRRQQFAALFRVQNNKIASVVSRKFVTAQFIQKNKMLFCGYREIKNKSPTE
jgi:hypothetical protein